MANLESTKLRKGVVFKDQNRVYLVLDYKHIKKGRGLATVRLKVRDIENGTTVEKTFTSNEKVDSIDLAHKSAQFLYSDQDKSYFMDSSNYTQFQIENEKIGKQRKFLTEGVKVKVLWMDVKVISIEIPKKVSLKVSYTEPAVVGNTATGATKEAKLETGFELQVPLFIKKDDRIMVNTEKGTYVSKA